MTATNITLTLDRLLLSRPPIPLPRRMNSPVASSPSVSLSKRAWYRRRLIQLGVALALASAVGGIAFLERVILLTAAGRWLDVGEPLRKPVDSVFILGGDADTRPFAAAALIRSGWARQALITQAPADAHEPSHPSVLRDVLCRRGVAPEAILELPVQVSSTWDEARALREFLELHPGHSVAVVTSDYHTRRARAIFRRQLAGRAVQVHFVSAPTERFKATNWWHCEQGWKMYIGEYVKMICSLGQ
jgi:uncharacterized SAM-binding protein YcdF (DUF218 family)